MSAAGHQRRVSMLHRLFQNWRSAQPRLLRRSSALTGPPARPRRRGVALLGLTADDTLGIGAGMARGSFTCTARPAPIGIDLAPEPCEGARTLLGGRGEVSLHVGDGVSLRPVADASIDKAFAFTVFQHLTRAQAAAYMAEFARVLRPGGRVCVQFLTGGDTTADQADDVREQSLSYSPVQVSAMVERAGLRLTNLELAPTDHAAYFWYWMAADKPAAGRAPERFEDRAY